MISFGAKDLMSDIIAGFFTLVEGSYKVGDFITAGSWYGTVTEISALGVTRQNAAYYSVHVSIDDSSVMLGQSASVYLPK